ncbi:hypothetical protein [Hanstruepera marina]|uniref:hypothetical protein n=1 Tax=Hanstruepera marina TaxID=2873265 RepID=UPI001CA62BB4|nr:hypothetical protein [Hanstruepera marina]
MIQVLPYHFERRSKNHFDWMLNIIKSESYFKADSIILDQTHQKNRNFNKSA